MTGVRRRVPRTAGVHGRPGVFGGIAAEDTVVAIPCVVLSGSARIQEDGSIPPAQQDFENNLSFRVELRRFQRWSEEQAASVGLTHVQHQLLVAIKGHRGPLPPAIRDIADYLLLQSHSAVGLVDRAAAAGFVRRRQDDKDARVVRVELTEKGDRLVTDLTQTHLAQLYKLADALNKLVPAVQQHE